MGRGRGRRVARKLKLQITGGQANPAPPVGPALGQAQVNIGEFVRQFNDATRDQIGQVVPVEITVYEDRSFTFITKTPPAAFLLKQAAGLEKGSGEPNRAKVGAVSRQQVEEIARTKMLDLNAADLDRASRFTSSSTLTRARPTRWCAGHSCSRTVLARHARWRSSRSGRTLERPRRPGRTSWGRKTWRRASGTRASPSSTSRLRPRIR